MGSRESATPVVTIGSAADSVVAGNPLSFTLTATPAPRVDLTVGVSIEPAGCELTQALKSVTIAAGETEATLTVPTEPTSGAAVGEEGCTVTATIAAGQGYRVGAPAAASASATLTQPAMPDPPTPMPPEVTITASASSVNEGSKVSFTLTAAPPPASELTVTLSWSDPGSFLDGSSPLTAIIPTSGTFELEEDTVDDSADEPNGSVTVTVEDGSGYTVGSPHSATVTVTDDDPATPAAPSRPPPVYVYSVRRSKHEVEEGATLRFALYARKPGPASKLTVNLSWSESGSFLADSPPPPETVTILPATDPEIASRVTFEVGTNNDNVDEPHGSVTVTVEDGSGYKVLAPRDATIKVMDND